MSREYHGGSLHVKVAETSRALHLIVGLSPNCPSVPRSVLSRFEIRPGIARGLETLDSKGSKENGSSSSNLQPQVKSKENAK